MASHQEMQPILVKPDSATARSGATPQQSILNLIKVIITSFP